MDTRPFAALRPTQDAAAGFASLPYDVFDDDEARSYVEAHPGSFLSIDRPETAFEAGHDMYAPEVYAMARTILDARIADGTLIDEAAPCYYLYRQIRGDCSQTGIVCLCSIDEYRDGIIKRHEKVRPEKMADRIEHIKALSTQTGPIFMAFRDTDALASLISEQTASEPLFDFVAEDGIRETVWRISAPDSIDSLHIALDAAGAAYIADGHHRCASAVQVGFDARDAAGDPEGSEPRESDWFMSVLFPGSELVCLPYNRIVHDRAGLATEALVEALREAGFTAERMEGAVEPDRKGCFGMYSEGSWWRLTVDPGSVGDDPVASLDASILQSRVLDPILSIADPTKDARIEFVGGARGTAELERRAGDEGVAFSLHATTMDQVMAVADAGLLMPPKSTWFEPKLKSGLFAHRI
ncbi:MAG: DUF1015 domain-containing protein [Atopobiaceae bacterium]|nr:DUF1015 domain-containing protein [Atopobiaceae bacterium]